VYGGAGRRPGQYRRVSAAVIASFFAVLLVAFFPPRAAAASGAVTVQLLPAAVTMSPGETVTVDMLIANTTAAAVHVIAIDIAGPAHAVPGDFPPPDSIGPIPAGGSVMSHFQLQASPGIESGTVTVLADVRNGSPDAVDQFVTGSLTLTAGTLPASPTAAFVSFPDKINDGQSITVAVSIANPSPFTIRQIQVTAVDSENLSLHPVTPVAGPFTACSPASAAGGTLVGCLSSLPPGRTDVLDLTVSASSRVQTGTQHVAVVVTGQAGPVTSTVVATTSAQVAIFGVDALSPFGLGTLFVLPGLVAVLFFLFLARYVYPKSKELPDTVKFTDASSLIFVVPPAALIYLAVWALLGVNLTKQAGTADVLILFAIGAGFGFAAWAAMAGIYYHRSGRKQFTVSDSAPKVLQRLDIRHGKLVVPEVVSGQLHFRYLADGPSGKLFACPPLKYAFAPGLSNQVRSDFNTAVAGSDFATVRRNVDDGIVTIAFARLSGVTELDRSAVQLPAEANLFGEEVQHDEM
jgi:hypothetical protein